MLACKLIVRFIIFVVFLLINFVDLFAGETGKIAGRIIDKQSQEPLFATNVIINSIWIGENEVSLEIPLGVATDFQGRYFILNLRPGLYSVKANYIGYIEEVRTKVQVTVDKTTRVDFQLTPRVIEGEEVTVTAFKQDRVEVDLTATKQVYNVSDVQSIAGVADISDILDLQADVIDDHFRGGRLGEAQYLLGGAAIVNPLNNRRAFNPIVTGLEQVEVYTSGFSAEYGNAQSGVVNMVTKEGGNRWKSRLEFSTTLPYYKVWEETFNSDSNRIYTGGSPYSLNNLDFYNMLNNEDEWLKENPVYPGRALYDPGYGFGPKYLPPRISWPPNPLTYADSIQIAHLGLVQWLSAARDVGMEYNTTLDKRMGFTTGGPISEKMKVFIAGRQTIEYCKVPTPNPDVNHQIMSSLVWQKDMKNKLKATFTFDDDRETYFSSSWRYWLFDRTMATSQISSISKQYGLEWKHVFNNATFMEVKTNVLDLLTENKISLLNDDEYVTVYMKNSNWTDYTAPSNHRIGRPNDDSGTEQSTTWSMSASLISQVNNFNLLKGGFQFFYHNIDVDQQRNRYGDADIRNIKFLVNPYEGAFYLQDKMEFEGMIANIGLRTDFYQLNTDFYADIYSPLRNPNYDPSKPYLERGPYYADSLSGKEATKLYMNLQPKIGVSFPVSETMVFHLNYGTFTQRPNFNQLFFNQITINNEIEILGNPRLEPEVTNAYDIGIVKGFGQTGITLDISAYYKDVKNLVETAYYYDEQQSVYRTYINRDYADIKGFHVNLERKSGDFRGYIRYNYESATGKSSNDLNAPVIYFETPDPNYGYVDLPDPEDVYLDYDRTHKVVLNMRYRTQRGFGPKLLGGYPLANFSISATMRYMTGRPYTDPSQGILYGKRAPFERNLKMRIERGFRIKEKKVIFYMEGFNVLNEFTWNYSRTFNSDYNTPRWFTDKDEILTYKLYAPYITSQDIYMLSNEPRHWRLGLIFDF